MHQDNTPSPSSVTERDNAGLVVEISTPEPPSGEVSATESTLPNTPATVEELSDVLVHHPAWQFVPLVQDVLFESPEIGERNINWLLTNVLDYIETILASLASNPGSALVQQQVTDIFPTNYARNVLTTAFSKLKPGDPPPVDAFWNMFLYTLDYQKFILPHLRFPDTRPRQENAHEGNVLFAYNVALQNYTFENREELVSAFGPPDAPEALRRFLTKTDQPRTYYRDPQFRPLHIRRIPAPSGESATPDPADDLVCLEFPLRVDAQAPAAMYGTMVLGLPVDVPRHLVADMAEADRERRRTGSSAAYRAAHAALLAAVEQATRELRDTADADDLTETMIAPAHIQASFQVDDSETTGNAELCDEWEYGLGERLREPFDELPIDNPALLEACHNLCPPAQP